MNGFLAVNKPLSFSSFDIVQIARKTTGIKKIGHTGTLDKEAQGILLLCIGKATKLVEKLMEKEKEYEAEGKLGEISDTDDASGTILKKRDARGISCEDIKRVINEFKGDIYQIPPMYSALKVKGRRLYEIAREGKTLKRKERKVYVKNIELLHCSPPDFKIRVVCGRGFYIRALIRDIGEKLGVGAYAVSIIRTRIGGYTLKDTISVEELKDREKILSSYIPI